MENERLEAECRQLQQAAASDATIDQAIGAVVVLKGIPPGETWRTQRDVSQGINTKLYTVAQRQ
ncbi:ANTAR domain-containing protein [Streptomyces sp. NPDC051896]|uniref:ANTAR domain-containing protein n=1 Tax=Streptomyces sp. NPDC051896 TaxID=3155416 RepID=UPI0034161382